MNAEAQIIPAAQPFPQPNIQAVQHVRRMRGGAQSHLMRASDGFYYVVKFQNNPQDVRVLANELFATRLAQKLGIPVPEPRVIEVSSWLIENTGELHCQLGGQRIPCLSGSCFGSRFIADPAMGAAFDYLPASVLHKVSNMQDFARVLVLDKWTCNSDGRQAVFTRSGSRYAASFIDQGYCFNAGEWSFPDSALRGVYPNYSVYEQVADLSSFEPALTRAEEADLETLWACAGEIPEEWYRHDRDSLCQLVEMLSQRRQLIRGLIECFRKSNRNPFPNWRG